MIHRRSASQNGFVIVWTRTIPANMIGIKDSPPICVPYHTMEAQTLICYYRPKNFAFLCTV